MRYIRSAITALCCALSFGATDSVLFDNVSAVLTSVDSIADDGPLYDSFSSGPNPLNLTDVRISLSGAVPASNVTSSGSLARQKGISWRGHPHRSSGSAGASREPRPNAAGGSITVALYGDSSGSPGTLLTTIGTLNDTSLTTGPTTFDFPLGAPFLLAANTKYWIGLSTANGSTAFWNWSLDVSGVGVSGQFFFNNGGLSPNTDGPYQMRVTAAAIPSGPPPVPAPSSLLLTLSGILAAGLYLMRRRYRHSS
jgi:hypothetical protein